MKKKKEKKWLISDCRRSEKERNVRNVVSINTFSLNCYRIRIIGIDTQLSGEEHRFIAIARMFNNSFWHSTSTDDDQCTINVSPHRMTYRFNLMNEISRCADGDSFSCNCIKLLISILQKRRRREIVRLRTLLFYCSHDGWLTHKTFWERRLRLSINSQDLNRQEKWNFIARTRSTESIYNCHRTWFAYVMVSWMFNEPVNHRCTPMSVKLNNK